MDSKMFSNFVVLAITTLFGCYSAVIVNNETVPSDALSELFFNEFRSSQGFINTSVLEFKDEASRKCALTLMEMVKQFPDLKVLPFFDAWGRLPSGILKGHLVDVGNFDQCVEASATLSELTGLTSGQYCFASIPLLQRNNFDIPLLRRAPQTLEARAGIVDMLKIFIGICVPDSCSAEFLTHIFQASIGTAFNGALSGVKVSYCTNGQKPAFRAIDIFAITFFSLFAALMILSSIYEFFVTIYKKTPIRILLAFSVISNGRKLFAINTIKSPNTIDCLTGIRVFSMIWVMYSHTYSIAPVIPMINTFDLNKWRKNVWTMHVLNATVSVDSFFFISGVLVAWLGFRELEKRKGKLNVAMMYVHRYIRLTPALAAGLLFLTTCCRFIGIGPFRRIFTYIEKCDGNNWWPVLLYIQNYYVQDTTCYPQTWYLAIDFQLYILSPLLLIPMWKWGKKFAPVLVVLSLLSIGCVMATYITEGYTDLTGLTNPNNEEKTYNPTHTRYSPWLVGFGLGYFMFINRGRTFRLSKIVLLLGWIVSFAIMASIIFAPYFTMSSSFYGTVAEAAMYESLKRVSWAIALAWITFACHFGFGGVIDSFLSHPIWQPLARLTYTLYLVHIPVMAVDLGSRRTETYFSYYSEILVFWSTFGMSLIVAIAMSLAFESPVLVLEKFILPRGKQETKAVINNEGGNHACVEVVPNKDV